MAKMFLQASPPLCGAIPPDTPHSVVVSLPEWKDNVEFSMSKKELFDSLETTYPRFVIHPFVKELDKIVIKKCDIRSDRHCLLFPSLRAAEGCCAFLHLQFPLSIPPVEVKRVTEVVNSPPEHDVFAVFFPVDQQETAMKFWTFTGEGLSSRLAEHCLLRRGGAPGLTLGLPESDDHMFADYYRSHHPLSSVVDAKQAIRIRFSGVTDGGRNIRGVPGVSPEDVYLFSTGMSAVWNAHQVLIGALGGNKSPESMKTAHVNILYVDSYKLLSMTTPGYHFFKNNTVDELEGLLAKGSPDCPAILGLFTDFPGNPHLRGADLPRLRALADKFHVPLIIDETVGCHLNVQVLPYADIVVASLTKVFSGLANVLGGALLLNPTSRFYAKFKAHMDENYEDTYFDSDALVMEMNSREINKRVETINRNSEALADMLYGRSVIAGAKNTVIQEVFYPKYQTRENYDQCLNTAASEAGMIAKAGYSGLLSVSFTSLGAAKVFYAALKCYKGPTLGSVFTVATPFTAIAFPPEKMQWVREHDLEEALVRFGVGTEDYCRILNSVVEALDAAECWAGVRTVPVSSSRI